MSSLIYNSYLFNVFRSMMHFDTDQFKMILVSNVYKGNKNHSKLSDIPYEIQDGNGYQRGGIPVKVNIKKDETNNRVDISLGDGAWENSSISAGGAIYYKAGSDDLVCFVEFNNEASSKNGTFTVTQSIVRIQN